MLLRCTSVIVAVLIGTDQNRHYSTTMKASGLYVQTVSALLSYDFDNLKNMVGIGRQHLLLCGPVMRFCGEFELLNQKIETEREAVFWSKDADLRKSNGCWLCKETFLYDSLGSETAAEMVGFAWESIVDFLIAMKYNIIVLIMIVNRSSQIAITYPILLQESQEEKYVMNFDSILRSNHDLKKNGYKIIRKLHKIEKKKGAEIAYSAAYSNTFFFVLSCRALSSIIKHEYPEAQTFCAKCDFFISYLDQRATIKARLDKTVLASFLHSYTSFFNHIISEKHRFVFDQQTCDLWNLKCIMGYIATWGKNH